MIFYVRINLLSQREVKRTSPTQLFVAIWALLLVAEVLVLYLWYTGLDDQLTQARAAAQKSKADIEALTAAKDRFEEREAQQKELDQQNAVFDSLKYDKSGPANAFAYLSYALTSKDDNLYNVDEQRAREDAGWDVEWDPSRIWLEEYEEIRDEDDKGNVDVIAELIGQAIDHEDVTELHRRLDSSNWFYDVRLGVQEVRNDDTVNAQYVRFKITARVNYNPEGIPMLASEAAALSEANAGAAGR